MSSVLYIKIVPVLPACASKPTSVLLSFATVFQHLKAPGSMNITSSDKFCDGKYPYKKRMKDKQYEKQKAELQVELLKAQRWAKETGQKISNLRSLLSKMLSPFTPRKPILLNVSELPAV